MAAHYTPWPKLVDLCGIAPFNGLMEKRGGALIDIDREALESRMRDYFDADLSWDEYRARQTALTQDAARSTPRRRGQRPIKAESFDANGVRATPLRPFETRWCYYTPVRPVWNEPRPALLGPVLGWQSFLDDATGGE